MGLPSFIGAAYDGQGTAYPVRPWKNGSRQPGWNDRKHPQPLRRGPSTLSPPVMDAVLRVCGNWAMSRAAPGNPPTAHALAKTRKSSGSKIFALTGLTVTLSDSAVHMSGSKKPISRSAQRKYPS
jgi:hypothetical protein